MKCPFCGEKEAVFHCRFAGGAKVTCCCLCAVKLGLKIEEEVHCDSQELEDSNSRERQLHLPNLWGKGESESSDIPSAS